MSRPRARKPAHVLLVTPLHGREPGGWPRGRGTTEKFLRGWRHRQLEELIAAASARAASREDLVALRSIARRVGALLGR